MMANKNNNFTSQTNYESLAKKNQLDIDEQEASGRHMAPDPNKGDPTAVSVPMATANPSVSVAPKASSGQTGQATPIQGASPINLAKPPGKQYDADGDEILGNPQTYSSAGSAGSGFVNLSHLLSLNKGSGFQSAKDFSKKVKGAGQSASGAIEAGENGFMDAADKGFSGQQITDFDPAAADAQAKVDAAKNAKYTGPADMASMSGYADLAKKVGAAQDLAKASQTPYGVAGEASKETGLSPTQSAASAFYMGVNNPNIKRAGAAFTNLQAALDKANNRAMDISRYSKETTEGIRESAAGYQKQIDDYKKSGAATAMEAEARRKMAEADANLKEREAAINEAAKKDNLRGDGVGDPNKIKALPEDVYANMKGVPQELIWLGMDYDEWVAEGSPKWDDYLKKHPEAQEALNRLTGRK